MFMLLLGSVKEPPPPLSRGMEADRTGVTTGNQGNRPGRNLPRTARHKMHAAECLALAVGYLATAPLFIRLSRPATGLTVTRKI